MKLRRGRVNIKKLILSRNDNKTLNKVLLQNVIIFLVQQQIL